MGLKHSKEEWGWVTKICGRKVTIPEDLPKYFPFMDGNQDRKVRGTLRKYVNGNSVSATQRRKIHDWSARQGRLHRIWDPGNHPYPPTPLTRDQVTAPRRNPLWKESDNPIVKFVRGLSDDQARGLATRLVDAHDDFDYLEASTTLDNIAESLPMSCKVDEIVTKYQRDGAGEDKLTRRWDGRHLVKAPRLAHINADKWNPNRQYLLNISDEQARAIAGQMILEGLADSYLDASGVIDTMARTGWATLRLGEIVDQFRWNSEYDLRRKSKTAQSSPDSLPP